MNKRGIVLVNLGSPDSTEVKDVRRYLREFLMDEKVIDMPYIPRTLLVRNHRSVSCAEERSGLQVDLVERRLAADCTYQTVAASIAAAF